jgi:hypothetical protein
MNLPWKRVFRFGLLLHDGAPFEHSPKVVVCSAAYSWSGSPRNVATAEPATLRSSLVGVSHILVSHDR